MVEVNAGIHGVPDAQAEEAGFFEERCILRVNRTALHQATHFVVVLAKGFKAALCQLGFCGHFCLCVCICELKLDVHLAGHFLRCIFQDGNCLRSIADSKVKLSEIKPWEEGIGFEFQCALEVRNCLFRTCRGCIEAIGENTLISRCKVAIWCELYEAFNVRSGFCIAFAFEKRLAILFEKVSIFRKQLDQLL